MAEGPAYNQHYVVAIIDDVLESAGPHFLTGHPRFFRGAGSISSTPFSADDLKRLGTFIRTRDDRDRMLPYIYDRLPDETRLVLHQIYTSDAVLSDEERTRLVLVIMIGMMAFYNDTAFRLDLRNATNISNVLFATEVAAADPATRPLDVRRVSLLTPAGPRIPHDFSRAAVFHFVRHP